MHIRGLNGTEAVAGRAGAPQAGHVVPVVPFAATLVEEDDAFAVRAHLLLLLPASAAKAPTAARSAATRQK